MGQRDKTSFVKKFGIGAGLAALGIAGKTLYDYHQEKGEQSFQSWLLERFFGLFSYPLTQLESRNFYEKGIEVIGDNTEKHIELPQLENIESEEVFVKGMQVLLFNNKNDKKQQVVFFLHGGAYVFQPAFPHFDTVEDIIEQTDAKVVMPIYPKAPNYSFKDAYPKVLEAYRYTLRKTASSNNITFLGDSAGGGFVLGLSSLLAHEELSQPRQLILISPWLDAGSDNPNMKEYEETDPLLPTQIYFQATGRLWARGEDNVYHPLVSPLYTNQIEHLPPVYIIAGGSEMLYPDILRFVSYLEEEGKEVHLKVKEELGHDFAIFNTPEGEKARRLISERILA